MEFFIVSLFFRLLGSAELTVEICDKSLNMQEHER